MEVFIYCTEAQTGVNFHWALHTFYPYLYRSGSVNEPQVSSIAYVVTFVTEILLLQNWQWQLGTCCMFAAWLNLILFLRRMPRMGIYIVMVGEVFGTFLKFFIFCFSFFLLAFGFTFYVLMENQVVYLVLC